MSPLLHPALSTSLSKSFGLNSPFSLAAMSTSLKDMSSSPGFSSMGMSLGRSFEERPKIEAQFFKNFTCCGLDLHDLHGLLEHFEECHVAYDDDDDDEDASLEGDDVAARMDDMDAEIESEGTISGPPSPRLMGNGQVPRFETKKSNLSSAFEAPDSPASPALHLDGGMELDMEMGDDDHDHDHHHHHHHPSAPTSSTGSASQQNGSAVTASISAFDPLHGSASKKRSSPPAAAFPPNPSAAGGVQLPPIGGGSRSRSASAQALDEPNDKAREEAEALSYLNPAAVNSPMTNNAPLPPSFLFDSSPNKTLPSSNQAQDPSQASTSAHHDFDFDDGIEAVQETDSEAEQEEDNAVAHGLVNGENSFASFGGANAATTTTLGAGQALPSLPAHRDHSATATLNSSNPLAAALHPLGQQGVEISPSSTGRPSYTPPSEKPFKCTVPGCDKSYKQQNGLKYHRLHGHCGSGSSGLGGGGGAGMPTSQQVAPPVATAVEVSGEVPNSSSSSSSGGGERFSEGKPFVCHVASCGKRYKKCVSLSLSVLPESV